MHDGLERVGAGRASSTCRTAAGWSYTAAWSRVHGTGSRSMVARQFSSHTSQPSSSSASTKVGGSGGRNSSARTPAPCTTRTGPRVGACRPWTCTRVSGRPSQAVSGTTSVRWSARVVRRGSVVGGGHARHLPGDDERRLDQRARRSVRPARATGRRSVAVGGDAPSGCYAVDRQRVHDEAPVVAMCRRRNDLWCSSRLGAEQLVEVQVGQPAGEVERQDAASHHRREHAPTTAATTSRPWRRPRPSQPAGPRSAADARATHDQASWASAVQQAADDPARPAFLRTAPRADDAKPQHGPRPAPRTSPSDQRRAPAGPGLRAWPCRPAPDARLLTKRVGHERLDRRHQRPTNHGLRPGSR